MNQQFGPLRYTVSIWALQAIIAIRFHEAAHGFVAFRFGDDSVLRPAGTLFRLMFDDEDARPKGHDDSAARSPCGSSVPNRRHPPGFKLTSTVSQPPMT
jgi:hypothetical protein